MFSDISLYDDNGYSTALTFPLLHWIDEFLDK